MQNVSREWRMNQQQRIVDESFVEVSLHISDPDSVEDAQALDNGSMFFSNTPQIVDGFDKKFTKFAMLEHNQWVLDESFMLFPRSNWGDTGFVSSEISDESGIFNNIPVITIYFSKQHDVMIPGLTINWSETLGEFAKDFNIVTYLDDVEMSRTKVIRNNNTEQVVFFEIEQYDRIDIEILRWCLPLSRARIERIYVGISKIYRKQELLKFEQSQVCDPLAGSLPKYSINFEIDNLENNFDPNNPTGLTKYLMERQKIEARYGYMFNGEMEWISAGSYFLSRWNAPQNGISAAFEARDLLLFMRKAHHKGMFQPSGVSLYDLAEQLLLEANIPLRSDKSVSWFISESLRDIYTTAPLPIKPISNCLQLIANAACCAIFFDRDGILYLGEPPTASFIGHSTISDNGAADFSNTLQIGDDIERDFIPYASAEHNIWSLDDTHEILDGDTNTGFVSEELCDSEGYFTVNPTITLTFERIHTSPVGEVFITWSSAFGEFAREFIVTGYSENTVIAEVHIADNIEVESAVDINLQNYDRITIEVVRWCIPHRHARIESIPSGILYHITNFNSFKRAEIELVRPISGTEVRVFNYFVTQELPTLFDGIVIINGTRTEVLRYSQPATNVSATVTNGTLVSAVYYTYSCELTITGTGNVNVIITGNQLNISESTVTANNNNDGEHQPINNPLITSVERATVVAKWALDFLSSRIIVSPEWRADPRLDVLDMASVENDFGHRAVRMTEVKYAYGGGFLGTGKGRVYIE